DVPRAALAVGGRVSPHPRRRRRAHGRRRLPWREHPRDHVRGRGARRRRPLAHLRGRELQHHGVRAQAWPRRPCDLQRDGTPRLEFRAMEDYTSRYKGEAVEIALFGGEYQDGILTAYCLIEDVAHVELNGHILVP